MNNFSAIQRNRRLVRVLFGIFKLNQYICYGIMISLVFCTVFVQVASSGISGDLDSRKKPVRVIPSQSVVVDNLSRLMWASHGNGYDISWSDAVEYCRKFRGGGFNDWRMPTQQELGTLFDLEAGKGDNYYISDNIKLSGCCVWASDKSGSKVASFDYSYGNPDWGHPASIIESRALPVRIAR